ncbi:MAG TPA: hypothetical protein VH682_23785 [Gemmataceae bacterium]|jgi:hypothetical protein
MLKLLSEKTLSQIVARGFEPPTSFPLVGMLDQVAVGTKNHALGDLALDGGYRPIVFQHIADGEVFIPAIRVMEFECPVIVETTIRAVQRLLERIQPDPAIPLAAPLGGALARATLVPPIRFATKGFADLKTAFVLLDQAVAADLPDTGRAEFRLRDVRKGCCRGEGGRGDRCRPLAGMVDPVTIRAEDDALGDLPANGVTAWPLKGISATLNSFSLRCSW